MTLESRSPFLLGRYSRQLRKSYGGAEVVNSQAERVHYRTVAYFESKSFAADHEAFSIAYPDKET